jgi:beta-galactosidase
MPILSRRNLLRSGLAWSASSTVAHSAWARAAALLGNRSQEAGTGAQSAPSPREKLLFDFGWKFQFGNGTDPSKDLGFGYGQGDFAKTGDFKFAKVGYDDAKWRTLNLPHDWAVELPFVWDEEQKSHGYKPLGRRYPETSVGWYRREFEIPASDAGRRIAVEFDGAFRDVLVFVNGCFIGRNDNGYAPFRFDITDFLAVGAKNCIVARVDASFGDGWFYEGAGIYRHVWLTKTDAVHFAPLDSCVRAAILTKEEAAAESEKDVRAFGQEAAWPAGTSFAKLSLITVVRNRGTEGGIEPAVSVQIFDPNGREVFLTHIGLEPVGDGTPAILDRDESRLFSGDCSFSKPMLWSPETPHLYTAVFKVSAKDGVRDVERITFGIRAARFTADKGFFLNGQSLKIQGTCNHQDHAGVGAALPDRLQYFRVGVLKEMGCNAVRTSHNMPTPEWVEACDRMGVMMMCETRQMSSSPEGLAQLATMVKRYRNSPSIILWSIGNEEGHMQFDMAEEGAKVGAAMVGLCHELDPTRVVSAAVNGDNKKGVSGALDIVGFNYELQFPDAFHQAHPTRPVYGSETASAISTRGEYETDPLRNVLSAYDLNQPGWGETAETWWTFYGTREWEAGGFAWTGFDYRGEPTPYGWPSINSQFGIVDTCGFPKDTFFYYKAWWGREPVLHLFPHWNFEGREGDEIPVWVHSNLDSVELFVNGKSQSSKPVPHLGHVEWKVRYEPGTIEARGTKNGQIVLTEKRETTGPVTALRLTADRTEIDADGEDLAMVKVEALDKDGRAVPTAQNQVAFKVMGEGALIGVGNGDPNCQESDKEPKRSLFNGLAQVILQSTKRAGMIEIEATNLVRHQEVAPAKLTITTKRVALRTAVPEV